jgi:alginate O-acetyltransferase complex protein AlgI
MWGLALAIYVGLKGLSWLSVRVEAPAWKHAAYLLGWLGMDAARFLLGHSARPLMSEWLFAFFKMWLGIVLIWVAVPLIHGNDLIVGWVGMIGIALILHFGLFHLLSSWWRRCGIPAVPIMNWPITSTSVAEFWGRRWNLAFRDLTHRFLFVPLVRRVGAVGALLTGFLISGLVHDLVISIPACGGWGGPTCFFALQGLGILSERSKLGRTIGLGKGAVGYVFCIGVILLPSPLLFHRPFVERVILPFLAVLGARS